MGTDKRFDFTAWKKKYFEKEIVDLKKYFTKEDFEMLEKLGIEIKDKIYTEYEFELLGMDLNLYYKDEDMTKEELEETKSLENAGVSREEYNKLLDKVYELNEEYDF